MIQQDRVRLYIDKANKDLKTALVLDKNNESFTEAIVFHCQQAVEKQLKAFLVKHNVDFPKTHDLEFLLDEAIAINKSLDQFSELAALFDEYAVEIRYEEVTIGLSDVSIALQKTEEITQFIQQKLK